MDIDCNLPTYCTNEQLNMSQSGQSILNIETEQVQVEYRNDEVNEKP